MYTYIYIYIYTCICVYPLLGLVYLIFSISSSVQPVCIDYFSIVSCTAWIMLLLRRRRRRCLLWLCLLHAAIALPYLVVAIKLLPF